MLTMVIPLYISEVSSSEIRGGLVVLQQREFYLSSYSRTLLSVTVSITIGILASFWIDYGTHYIGGTRCSPNVPYTGGTTSSPTFDPYKDVGPTVVPVNLAPHGESLLLSRSYQRSS
jgi:hypothetical protein